MDEHILNSIDLKLSLLNEMLDRKISTLTKISAIGAVKDLSLNEQISLLSSVGLNPTEIASCLGKTPNTVRVLLHRERSRIRRLPKKEMKTTD